MPEAGWYEDPSGAPQHRYFDGEAWTEQVRPFAPPSGPPADGRPKGETRGNGPRRRVPLIAGAVAILLVLGIAAAVYFQSARERDLAAYAGDACAAATTALETSGVPRAQRVLHEAAASDAHSHNADDVEARIREECGEDIEALADEAEAQEAAQQAAQDAEAEQYDEILNFLAEDIVARCRMLNPQIGARVSGFHDADDASEQAQLIVRAAVGGREPTEELLEMVRPGTIPFDNLTFLCGDDPYLAQELLDWMRDSRS